jgi:magnesium chelatase family protein
VAGFAHRLLPPLDGAAALEVTALRSAAGMLDPAAPLVTVPSFVPVHEDLGLAEMAGEWEAGVLSPGDASLAHRGVLFLGRAHEFRPEVLDALLRRVMWVDPGKGPVDI